MSTSTVVAEAPVPGSSDSAVGRRPLTARLPGTVVGLVAAVLAWFRVSAGQTDNLHSDDGALFSNDWAVGAHPSFANTRRTHL